MGGRDFGRSFADSIFSWLLEYDKMMTDKPSD